MAEREPSRKRQLAGFFLRAVCFGLLALAMLFYANYVPVSYTHLRAHET